MMAKKKRISALLSVLAACCLLAISLFFSSTILVSASNSNKGTNTEDEWHGSQTTGNLITIHDGSLVDQGWQNITEQIKPSAVWYKDANLDASGYGWGIQAAGSSDDIGNKEYGGGVWYRITLSEADRIKANKGDLKISASSMNYRQATANTYVSLKLFFDDSNELQIDSEVKQQNIASSAYVLSITDRQVPENTASIRYYVSNWGNLTARPFIGGLTCTLTDNVAPQAVNSTLGQNAVITERGGAIAGDIVEYSVVFDEKITLINKGTAKISVAGTSVDDTSCALSESNGVSTITYKFTLPKIAQNGIVSFSGVTNCIVADEAGNESTINYTGTPGTLKYYKQMSVSSSISHLTVSGENTANFGTAYTATLSANTGYSLPSTIKVTIGGATLANGTDYTYDSSTGALTVKGSVITGDIVVTASGVANSYAVSLDMQGGNTGSVSTTATYDSAMPSITLPVRSGYTFGGYFSQTGGKGTQYYSANGSSMRNFDQASNITLYALWTANKYTVKYNSNKPSGASGTVTGNTASSSHTYDTQKALTTNGYSLTGWTFQGWATSPSGSVVYENGAQVNNLTAEDGDTINLYAVWKANTYTIVYNSNKPSGASGTLTGSTASSSHTYDTQTALTSNGYSLTGWTFQGWATSANGSVVYENGAQVINLTAEANGTINLYAVWRANTYTVVYNANQPTKASSAIGGSMQNSSHTYDIAKELSANGYSLTGWTFQGWATSPNGNVIYTNSAQVKNLTAEDGDTINLYAVWEQTLHQIAFNACGGSGSSTVSVLYDDELSALVTEPSRTGYNFKGYYTQENGNGVMYYAQDFNAVEGLTYTVESNLVLYAYWVPIKYDIELYSQGQYVGIIENVVYGELLLPSAQDLGISRLNYDFVGWNLYEEQNWSMYNAGVSYNVGLADFEGEKISIYAAWLEKNIYTINFDANGGFGAPAMAQAHEDESVILSATIPSRADYTFVGWAETTDAVEAQYLPEGEFTMGDSVVTLYAVWRLNPSLSYSANGGEFISDVLVVYPAAGSLVTITVIKPVRTGYDFIGWALSDNAETAQYVSGGTFTMPIENTLLYAVWQRTEFTVSHNIASGYAIEGLSDKYLYGDTLEFTVMGENPKVYINGTLVACDGEGKYSFTVTDNISVTVADSSLLVLIYSANGGSDAPTDGNIYSTGSEATLSQVIPLRTGYTFCGWSISKDAQSADYEAGDSLTFSNTDVILYAVWGANSYKVSYNAVGGEGEMQDSDYSYGTIGYLSDNVFTKQGFTFVGWSLSEGGECVFADGDEVLNLSEENGADIALYAVWEQSKTLITFDADGGTGGSANLSVGYGETLPNSGLIAPVLNGYTFGGYFTEKEGNGEMLFDSDMLPVNYTVSGWDRTEQNLTLYAYWIPTSETIMNDVAAAIDEVQTNLDNAVAELQTAINTNGADIEAKVSALDTAYKAADALIRTDMTTADEELNSKITALETAMTAANSALQTAIDTVQSNLDNAVAQLQATITENEADIEAKVSALDTAYKAADALIRTDMTTADEELNSKITALETAMTAANSALQTAIDTVQSNLDNAVAQLQATITENEADIEAKVSALDTAYKAADALIRTDMTTADEELNDKITALETAMNEADSALQTAIETVQTNLDNAVAELQTAINTNETDIEAKVSALDTAYKAADALIRTDMTAADEELNDKITALEIAMNQADSALQTAIETVQTNLDNAVAELQATITENEADIEAKVSALDTAYKAADALIRTDMTAADEELNGKITALETAMNQADAALQTAIDTVQTNLDNAVAELEAVINTNEADIETKVSALDTAYKAANALLRSDMATVDEELNGKITALETAMTAANSALQTAIDTVQTNLDNAVSELQATITENETDIEAKVLALDTAYKAADTLLRSDMAAADEELNGKITALETAMNEADSALQTAIDTVQTNLDNAVAELEAVINTNEADIEAKVSALDTAYKAADALLRSDMTAADEELNGKITALETAMNEADTALQTAIETVQSNLDNAVAELQTAINTNEADIESKVSALDTAYKAADTLLRSDLTAKDEELEAKITALETAMNQADAALQTAIETVQTNLDNAVAELEAVINTNEADIEAKVSALDTAYKAADALLRSDMATADEELNGKITALETAMNQADTALQSAIDTVQTNLDNAVAELEAVINTNESDIESKVSALDTAYKAADTLLRSDMAAADNALGERITALETAMNEADTALQTAIETVQTNLDNAVAELQATITENEADIEAKVSALDTAYKAADTLLRSDMAAADEELNGKITALETAMNQADSALQTAIDTVQSNLDNAVAELEAVINTNEADIEAKVSALDTAYKAADTLLRSDMATADEEIEAKITALETAMNQADSALQTAIDTVQSNLDSAVTELQAAINANEADIEAKVSALDTAYKAADALLRSDMATADEELNGKITALETAMNQADSALRAGIQELQERLNEIKSELDIRDNELESKLNSVIAENEKTELTYRIIIIVIAVIEVALVALLVVYLIKKKKTKCN